jgi:hypothetical protein
MFRSLGINSSVRRVFLLVAGFYLLPAPALLLAASLAKPSSSSSSSSSKPADGKEKAPAKTAAPETKAVDAGARKAVFTGPPNSLRHLNPDGSAVVTHADGRKWEVNRAGMPTSFSRPGMQAKFDAHGRPSYIHDSVHNVTVMRNASGGRTVVSTLPGGVSVASFGKDSGYVVRPLKAGYVQQTVVSHGQVQVNVLRTFNYNGVALARYVPPVVFKPKFSTWAMAPWATPVPYAWEWRSEPWFAFDAGYFAPEPAYSSASLWLTDYTLASDLSAAYPDQPQASAAAAAPVPAPAAAQQPSISPAVKLAIAEEVRQQISLDKAAAERPPSADAAPSGLPDALDPKQRVFIVSTTMDAVDAGGARCALTPGDILVRTGDQLGADQTVGVSVLNSKAGDCPANTVASLNVIDLQSMHNDFHQKVIAGEMVLAKKEGTAGIPAGPAAGMAPSKGGQAPPADPVAETALINQQQAAGNQLEAEAGQAANSGG